jgi:hypothetical protein
MGGIVICSNLNIDDYTLSISVNFFTLIRLARLDIGLGSVKCPLASRSEDILPSSPEVSNGPEAATAMLAVYGIKIAHPIESKEQAD